VARVLPRHWDGSRLLRFLTGLAMIALAFTAHVAPPALTAAPPTPTAAPVAQVAPAERATSRPAPEASAAVVSLPAAPVETPVVIGSAVILALITGFALRVRAGRAPPLA
jgi:hypothetical protein